MFTSEHWRRLRDTSRPRLAFSAGQGLALAVTLVLCTRALAVWTSDQNYRIQAVNALGPETRVLITGSSHVFATLNPALIHIPSMNLAAPVCSYVCVEGIVRGNLAKVPQLEALIIELDVVPLFYDTLRAYRGDCRPLLELDPALFAMAISPWQKYELWRDRTLDALLARLEQDLPGSFVYWDFGELPWLLDTDYRNGDHINDNAAARVSAAFEQKLES